MPLMVEWTTSAPAARAMIVLATPMPKSMWKWVSSGFLIRFWVSRTK